MTGLELKKMREDAGLTQSELADRIGKSLRTVQLWEKSDKISKSQKAIIDSILKSEKIAYSDSNTLKEPNAIWVQYKGFYAPFIKRIYRLMSL